MGSTWLLGFLRVRRDFALSASARRAATTGIPSMRIMVVFSYFLHAQNRPKKAQPLDPIDSRVMIYNCETTDREAGG